MGASQARLFAREGAKVVFGDVLDDAGRKVEAEIHEEGNEAIYIHLDVTKEDDWRAAVEAAVGRYRKLDILVNNAGITRITNVENTSESEWDLVMDINAKGAFLGTKAAIPEIRKAGGGSIVNISSITGLVGGVTTAYSASKGAVRLLTKCTAIQYAKEGIRANSVYPGPIATPMTETIRANVELEQGMLGLTPLGRWGQPEDVAYGALFLASDESSFMTGSELVIDGGWTAQ